MSGLIKAGDHSHGLVIAPLDTVARPSAEARRGAVEEPEVDPLVAEIERLLGLLTARDAEINSHAEALAAARADGEAFGRAAAEEDFIEDRAKALEVLEAGILAARAALDEVLAEADALAILVAREALDKLFTQPGERVAAVESLVRRQFEVIGRDLILALEVSRLDFPDTSEVQSLAQRLECPEDGIKALIDLPAGACRLRLRLGTLDIGLDQQWGAVRQLLSEYIPETVG